MSNVHCIPVGGQEPIHQASRLCWCFPIRDSEESNLYVHNALDCREKWERQGIQPPYDSLWVTIVERLESPENTALQP